MPEEPEANNAGEAETSTEAAAASSWDDLQIGFSGNPSTKLDERGRLKMPAEFKAFLEKKYGKGFNAFYITSTEGLDAEIYPMPEWQQRMAKVLKMPASLPERKDLLGRYTLYGGRADMDPQGRMQLPDELRKAGLTNIEVKVSGEGNLLRVTCLDRLREYVHANPVTASLQEVWAAHGV